MSLAFTWAGHALRWVLFLVTAACVLPWSARAEAVEGAGSSAGAGAGAAAPPAAPAASGSTHAPGVPGAPASDDLFGMNLSQLMKVEVPVVYGASKHEQKITEAPSAVSIVTAEDIKLNGYRTLKDILQSVRGFYVTYDRVYSFIGARGVNRPGDFGGRILITVDGHRMNDPVYDSALSGTEGFLDVDMIDRVEVIRGPGSSLYGNNAVFGVINVITRQGRSLDWAEASGSVASYDTYVGRFTLGHVFTNNVEFIASGTIRDSVGQQHLRFPEWKSINNGMADNLDHDHGTHYFASVRYQGLSLEGGYNERRKEVPSAAVGVVFNESPAEYHDERAFVELKYRQEFAGDWSVLGRVFYDHYHFDAFYVFDYGGLGNPVDYTVNRDVSLSQFVGGEVQVAKTFLGRHRITVGGEFRTDLTLDLKNFDLVSHTTYLDTHNNADNFGLYAQGEFVLFKPLTLNAGVRYDHFQTVGDTINPRAGLIYNPFKDTTFKLLYGQAFRAPNAFELGYISPTYDVNPNLQPEEVHSYDFVWEQGFGEHYRFTAALFYNDIRGLITKQVNTATGHSIFRNTDSVDSIGQEVELEARWANGWIGKASYTYSDSTDSGTGSQVSNSPRHLGKANLSVPLYMDKLYASAEVQAMSGRRTVDNRNVSAFAICNLTLFSRELTHGVEASVSVYNLFDTHYSDPVAVDFRKRSIEQDGRTFRAKLTFKF